MNVNKLMDTSDATFAAERDVQSELQTKFSELLESKHLYQRVKVDVDAIATKYQALVSHSLGITVQQALANRLNKPLTLVSDGEPVESYQKPALILKNMKLFCSHCGEREVFSCIWSQDLADGRTHSGHFVKQLYPQQNSYQGLLFAYQCQRCKKDPTIFVIRRQNWTLSLEGRSPIEEVEVPKVLPKEERDFFKNSVIAYQSGRALPAILYLRVFIEAFCRRMTGIKGRETGDELAARYSALLPQNQSSEMPSLRHWYARLSEAIHDGREDSDLYTDAREELIRHFEFRRLFRIPQQAIIVPDPDVPSQAKS